MKHFLRNIGLHFISNHDLSAVQLTIVKTIEAIKHTSKANDECTESYASHKPRVDIIQWCISISKYGWTEIDLNINPNPTGLFLSQIAGGGGVFHPLSRICFPVELEQ